MKRLLIAFALLAGCGPSGPPAGDGKAAGPPAARAPAGEGGGLTGLYEGGEAGRPDQLCMIGGGDEARFGLVVWGANDHSCSGAGQAVRRGERLTLRMAGDESCEIAATIRGGTVALPANVPEGCAYYCGARARLVGAAFARKGSTAEEARKAKDLVGESLCG